jgi:hypothetical protein
MPREFYWITKERSEATAKIKEWDKKQDSIKAILLKEYLAKKS